MTRANKKTLDLFLKILKDNEKVIFELQEKNDIE